MQKRTDEEIIYSALLRYQECCGSKKTPVLNMGKVITLRAQFLQQVEKYVLLFNSSKTSIVEKRALCNKGKMLYQKYCFQLKVNPEVDTTRLAQKMDELLRFIASCEAEKFQPIRERQIAGDKIDLEQLFAEDKHIRVFMGKPIDTVVSEVFSNKKYTVVGEDNAAVYMTASGAKYHRKDCPYCKGKSLVKATLLKVENIGLKPCKCIEKESTLAFAKYSYMQLKWVVIEKPAAREAYVNGKLNTNWEEIVAQIDDTFEDFAKDYVVVFE